MGVVPPQGRNGVRETSQLTDFRSLFPSFPIKIEAKQDLDIFVVFLVALELWQGASRVTDK